LTKLPGVIGVTRQSGSRKAHIIYNPRVSAPADFRKAVEDAGYQYLGVEGNWVKVRRKEFVSGS